MKTKILLVSGFLLVAAGSYSQVNSDSLIAVYSAKMSRYLDKDGRASEVFAFTKEGIEVYQPETDSSKKKLEYLIYWSELFTARSYLRFYSSEMCFEKFRRKGMDKFQVSLEGDYKKMEKGYEFMDSLKHKLPKPLKTFKILLDPGHIGGDLETAKKEKKWVEMKNPPVQLIEGNLTLATVKILKKKLEAEGATVMLTRDAPGISAFGITFEKWNDSLFLRSLDSAYARGDVSFEEKEFLLKKATHTEIFRRFFLAEDMRERVRKINAFNPDLTLIIHYNVDETNVNWNKPTKKNFNMAFVPGSFIEDELLKPVERVDFLRLLLTDQIDNSIEFSKFIVESLEERTRVPAAMDSCAVYLKGNCLNTGAKGVFCRNLALTRMVKGTLCYGESLYQDNINECKALSKLEITIDGIKTSKRVEEVADAYFEGIMKYVKAAPALKGGNAR